MRKSVVLAACIALALAASISVAVGDGSAPMLTSDVAKVRYPEVVTLATSQTAGHTYATFRARRNDREADGWVELGTVPVSPNDPGMHTFIVRPKYNSSYTVTLDGGSASEPVYVPVYVPLSTPKAGSLLRVGTATTLSGTIRPLHGDPSLVSLQWQRWNVRTRRWVTQPATTVETLAAVNGDTSRWTYRFAATRAKIGLWQVRAVHECPRHTRSYSAWKRFTVM
jgi:hypothetical protein